MKKILAVLLALYLITPGSFAQDDEIRPAAIGVSFILNDFSTADRIRTGSLSKVLANKQWAKFKEMAPGIAITYFKGLRKHIDFAGTLAGSFVSYPLLNRPASSGDKFLLEADASVNLKMVSEKYWVQPYLIAIPDTGYERNSKLSFFQPDRNSRKNRSQERNGVKSTSACSPG